MERRTMTKGNDEMGCATQRDALLQEGKEWKRSLDLEWRWDDSRVGGVAVHQFYCPLGS